MRGFALITTRMAMQVYAQAMGCLVACAMSKGGGLLAQSPTPKADQLYQAGKQGQAAERYERYLESHVDDRVRQVLVTYYMAQSRWAMAEKHQTHLAFAHGSPPEAKRVLATLLQRQGKFDAARIWYEKYAQESADSTTGQALARQCAANSAFLQDSLGYQLQLATRASSKDSDQLPVLNAGDLVWVSDRKGKRDAIWLAARSQDGMIGKPVRLPRRRVASKPKGAFSYLLPGQCLTNVGYGCAQPLSIDSLSLDALTQMVGTPMQMAMSSDGQTMVFPLRIPTPDGTSWDLYSAHLHHGKWTGLRSLGQEVNTDGDEAYPFFTNDSTLYFASDHTEGLGGYDMYSVRRIGDQWIERRHEGAPLNSAFDDYGFCLLPGQPLGYFTSNRPGGLGAEDIYAFRRFKVLEGQVVDSKTYLPLPNVRVEVVDINQQTHYCRTDAQGRFKHYFRVGQEVFAKFFLDQYHDRALNISARKIGYDENLAVTVTLDQIQRFQLEGTITDARSQEPIPDAVVRLVGDTDIRSFSNRKGQYAQELRPATAYRAIFFKPGYVPEIMEFTTGPESQPQRYVHPVRLRKGGFHYLEGRTIDTERDRVVGGATVQFLDPTSRKEIDTQLLGNDGMFYKVVDGNAPLAILASKEKYFSARIDLAPVGPFADTLLDDLKLVPLFPDKVLKTLYFPYKSDAVDSAGLMDIMEVVAMLRVNPDIGLEITAYTDARGGAAYNKQLSQARADLLVASIVAQGIDSIRLRAYGKGEEQPFNNCRDGVECTEELHAQNRRAEIKVVKTKDWVQND